jgi:molybdopterin converting factor small subunit
MAKVCMMPPLRRYTDSKTDLESDGATVDEVLRDLGKRFPMMASKLFKDDGSLKAHFIIYLDGKDIRLIDEGVMSLVEKYSEIRIFAALAGG